MGSTVFRGCILIFIQIIRCHLIQFIHRESAQCVRFRIGQHRDSHCYFFFVFCCVTVAVCKSPAGDVAGTVFDCLDEPSILVDMGFFDFQVHFGIDINGDPLISILNQLVRAGDRDFTGRFIRGCFTHHPDERRQIPGLITRGIGIECVTGVKFAIIRFYFHILITESIEITDSHLIDAVSIGTVKVNFLSPVGFHDRDSDGDLFLHLDRFFFGFKDQFFFLLIFCHFDCDRIGDLRILGNAVVLFREIGNIHIFIQRGSHRVVIQRLSVKTNLPVIQHVSVCIFHIFRCCRENVGIQMHVLDFCIDFTGPGAVAAAIFQITAEHDVAGSFGHITIAFIHRSVGKHTGCLMGITLHRSLGEGLECNILNKGIDRTGQIEFKLNILGTESCCELTVVIHHFMEVILVGRIIVRCDTGIKDRPCIRREVRCTDFRRIIIVVISSEDGVIDHSIEIGMKAAFNSQSGCTVNG